MDIGAYLERIGLASPVRPNTEGLGNLQRGQLTHIPFENFDIHLGRDISLPAGTWHIDDVMQVWEWLDEPIESARQIHDLLTLAQARSAAVYIKGKRSIRKFTLSKDQKRALRDVISAYQASGGSLSP